MKTIEVTFYTAKELKEKFPDGFKRALEKHGERVAESPAWSDECVQSLKAMIWSMGCRVPLKDLSVGAYSQGCYIKLGTFAGEDFTGRRAFAWLENELLAPLRLSWTKDRVKNRRHNEAYRSSGNCRPYCPGMVPPCPFTGVCYDDDYLDAFTKSLREGRTVKEAFQDLADTCRELLERDIEDQSSERAFIEDSDANDETFEETGDRCKY